MSERFPGGVISKTAPVPTGPYENGTAPGIWTLEQQAEFVRQGIWPIAGNVPNYIEDVFQTWLYTGNGTSQTITNGVNLSGRGGMAWIKTRSVVESHVVVDTVRGASNALRPNSTAASINDASRVSAFTASGFTVGNNGETNDNNVTYASWTFREQPKFFDVVTYTGTAYGEQVIPHNLGSVPGMIIVKRTDSTSNWTCYHRSLGATKYMFLNTTGDAYTNSDRWNDTEPTSTNFTVGSNLSSGGTYVAYLFAHNAGGFGLTGTDNVISCGSFTTNGSGNATVNLGYEPQWVLIKQTDGVDNWYLNDNMRGMAVSGNQPNLSPNLSAAEQAGGYNTYPNATGFTASVGIASKNYIYIAIRRGPMKVPTTGTSVYFPDAGTNGTNGGVVPTPFPIDMAMTAYRSLGGVAQTIDKLRGIGQTNTTNVAPILITSSTASEAGNAGGNAIFYNATNNSITRGSNGANPGGAGIITWFFGRAPGFFDEVCYTGTGSATTQTHNLGVAPELMIVKRRNTAGNGWATYCAPLGNTAFLYVNSTGAADSGFNQWNNTSPTATQFSVSTSSDVNASGGTYVAYLFASCPGVSRVGSYTGTGATQVINCGFTGGARFVLIKATSTTGNWLVWDSARGIVSGNDPYLALNSTAAEVTNTDWVDTAATGFELSNAGGNLANSNGVSYIFLAIA